MEPVAAGTDAGALAPGARPFGIVESAIVESAMLQPHAGMLGADVDADVTRGAVQDRAVRDRAVQDRAVHDRAVQDRAVHDRAVQDRAVHDRAVQDGDAIEATVVPGTSSPPSPAPSPVSVPAIDIVIPVYNEAAGLDHSIRRLHRYLSASFPLTWTITIADNASTDATLDIARQLASELGGTGSPDEGTIRVLHLDRKGRGRALRTAWSTSLSPVVCYMDVDLSTGLDALLPLVAPLISGHSDVAIGSRLARGAQVVRGPRREIISRIYNRIVRAALRTSFTDAQCGFKAVRSDVAADLLPLVEDDAWFFDTELLAISEHNGLRIHEVPVDWVDDPDSRVDVVATARDDLAGIARLLGRLSRGETNMPVRPSERVAPLSTVDQLIRFGSIGLVSTVVAAALFLVMAPAIGTVVANAVAFGICAIANAAANRRYTFALQGRAGRSRHFTATLVLGVVPLVLTTMVLVAFDLVGMANLGVALVAVLAINGAATALKFVLLRRWVYGVGSDEPLPL